MEVDELFPVAEALQMLRFAEIEGGDIRLTETGKQFAEAGDRRAQEDLPAPASDLRAARRAHPPRADERASHAAPKSRFFDELEDYMARGRGGADPARGHQLGPLRGSLRLRRRSQTFSLENPT